MDEVSNTATSLSLLGRLKLQPTDQQAWEEFVARYGTKVLAWCRNWGLQESDAADVCQTVLLKLSKEIARFERRPGGSLIYQANGLRLPKDFDPESLTVRAAALMGQLPAEPAHHQANEPILVRHVTATYLEHVKVKHATKRHDSTGQWNAMPIECVGDEVNVRVNGVVVNRGNDCTAGDSRIAIRAEDPAVDFHELEVTPISKLSI